VLVEQLQFALTSRVIIEQAKGVLAERRGVDMAEAFTMLRKHARNNNLRLADVAKGIVSGTVDLSAVSGDQRR
jgi:AmiR/NasT family two-component response regulator